MGTWESETVKSTFDPLVYSTRSIDGRAAGRASAVAPLSATSVVGIKASEISIVTDQINDSIAALEAVINKIGEEATSDTAYKGEEVKQAVDAYIESVKEYCRALTTNLLAFSDKLKDVEAAWRTSTENISATINTATTGMSSYSERYTEQL